MQKNAKQGKQQEGQRPTGLVSDREERSMAVIGLREDEYADLLSEVEGIHDEIREMLNLASKKISELNRTEGGFSVKDVSRKIDLLLEEVKALGESLDDVFEAQETIIQGFQSAIDDYDSPC